MVNVAAIEEKKAEIGKAGFARLLEIRNEALEEARRSERWALECESAGRKIPWEEDAAYLYREAMRRVALCAERLALLYGEMEDDM